MARLGNISDSKEIGSDFRLEPPGSTRLNLQIFVDLKNSSTILMYNFQKLHWKHVWIYKNSQIFLNLQKFKQKSSKNE